jgi:hypothetical protein
LITFWPVLLAGLALSLLPDSKPAPETPAAPGVAPTPAPAPPPAAPPVDPSTAAPPPDAVTAPAAADPGFIWVLLILPLMIVLVLVLANSSYAWQRRMLTGEPARSFSWGREGFRPYLRSYVLLALSFFAILGVIGWLALAYPEEIGAIAADGTVAERAQFFYVFMTTTMIFAILCARLSIRLPSCAAKGGLSQMPVLRERSVWQAIELPAIIFLTTWPIQTVVYLLQAGMPQIPSLVFDLVDYAYMPAVFASGLAFFYRALMTPASMPSPVP